MTKERSYTIFINNLKKYCAIQERCKWDVVQKMKKLSISKSCQTNILEELIKEKYLDEERYSKSFCRGKFKTNKWGRNKIKSEMRKRKISELYIKKGLQEINPYEYELELNQQYHKKKNITKAKNNHQKQAKIALYLISKGYESELIWEKIRQFQE